MILRGASTSEHIDERDVEEGDWVGDSDGEADVELLSEDGTEASAVVRWTATSLRGKAVVDMALGYSFTYF